MLRTISGSPTTQQRASHTLYHPTFTDEHGARRGDLVRIDQLLITLADARGETVCYLEVPMDLLSADIDAPPG